MRRNRTTGAVFDAMMSRFCEGHDNGLHPGHKRLYMTAPHAFYGDSRQADWRVLFLSLQWTTEPTLAREAVRHQNFSEASLSWSC